MDVRKEEMDENKASRVRLRRRDDDGVGIDGGVMENCCGEGRVWIFLVLGILALVFSCVLTGVYMNVRALTSSVDSVEVMPSFVPAAAGGLAGLLVLLLFWKRYKVLVYAALVMCAVAVALCVIAAVLTGTHVLQPLLSVSACVYNRRDKSCRCATLFRRDKLELDRVADGEQAYLVMQEVSSCADIEDVLPGMMFTMIGIYGVVSIVCVAAGVISLLVYQTELRRKYLEEIEDDLYSPPSSPSSSDNYAEHHSMLPAHMAPLSSSTTLVNIYTNPSSTANEEDSNANDDGNTTPSDLIYSPADVPMGYAEACRMRRCQSFSQPRQGMLREGSPGSSTSSQTASLIGGERNVGGAVECTGKLKEHRKKGRRAVTLHGLDREQLLLILSLQMRYLQESDQSAKREGTNSNINYLNNNNVGGRVSGLGPEQQAEPSLLYSDQRRAVTPTPRQERLSSSRTTDDDLDYRPAKLARSHTPQPYHFKNPGQYSQNLNIQPQLPFHPYQQQQKLQQQPMVADNKDEEEPPTLITYDLRNVTKVGPIVYENVPLSASSPLSYYGPEGHSSHSSPVLHSSGTTKLTSRPPQAGQLQPPPVYQSSDHTNQVLILGGNIQGTGKPQNQLSRQTSQASTSSQPSLESSPSDTRKLVPSKEKMPDPGPAKVKGKKKSKKEKNLKKDDEIVHTTKPSGLSRTDSNKAGAVADRWQTLMEDGPKQAQTLWENVQRKIVSDPQTPDSTLDVCNLLSDHQPHGTPPVISSYAGQQITPRHSSFQTGSSQKLPHQLSPTQIVPNGILKNSNVITNYSYGTNMASQNMGQNLPSPLNPSQNMQYPNPNPIHSNQHSAHYHNAFVPVANSSVENYEDIDEVFPPGPQPIFVPSSAQSIVDLPAVPAPPKPPRILGKQVAKFGSAPKTVQPVCENLGQNLRPKSYMNAVDKEAVGRASFVGSASFVGPSSLRAAAQGTEMEHHMMTHLLMEGPVKDRLDSHVMDRPANDNSHFQVAHEYLYAQPHAKAIPSSEVVCSLPEYSPGHIYQNAYQRPDEPEQLKKLQPRHRHFNTDNVNHPQWSAFQSLSPNHQSGPSFYEYSEAAGHEICDTDLDDLPRPQRHRQQQMIGRLYSPPPYAAASACQPHEPVGRLSSTRSGSSSSCEPHNTSCTSSERSCTPVADLQRGLDIRGQGHNVHLVSQSQMRGHQPSHITDRRFCVTQHQQHQQHQQPNHL